MGGVEEDRKDLIFYCKKGSNQRVMFLLALRRKKLPDYSWNLFSFDRCAGSTSPHTSCSAAGYREQSVGVGREFQQVILLNHTKLSQSYGTIDYDVSDTPYVSCCKQRGPGRTCG